MTASNPPDLALVRIPPPIALSLDLDDTLWPIWPTIQRAEEAVHAWLTTHAPATAARYDRVALRQVRNEVAERHPEWLHDLSVIRRESLREALTRSGDDPALAEPGFELFFDMRQQVVLYPDARDGLERIARRFPIIAVTNGNSDLGRVGLSGFFRGSVSAKEFGIAKPDPAIFLEGCRRLGVAPSGVLHVGDDLMLDVDGALKAGLDAVWMRREAALGEAAPELGAPYHVVSDMAALADALGC